MVGEAQQGEAQKASFKRAVDLYEQYVLATSALLSEKVRSEGQTLLSEHALRQCMLISGLLGDVSSARRVYAQFVKTVTRRLRDWQPEPQTVQMYEEVTRASEDE
jgi:DNA-binding SARP family transcriptional activator